MHQFNSNFMDEFIGYSSLSPALPAQASEGASERVFLCWLWCVECRSIMACAIGYLPAKYNFVRKQFNYTFTFCVHEHSVHTDTRGICGKLCGVLRTMRLTQIHNLPMYNVHMFLCH